MKKFKFKINGSEYEVSVSEIDKDIAEIEVNGTPFTVEIEKHDKYTNRKPAGKVTPINTPIRNVIASSIKAPLPGSIMKVLVKVGDSVKRGDLLLTMESMKMENNILAEQDGVVKTVHVQTGQTVMQDDDLIEFEGVETIVAPTAPIIEEVPAPVAQTKSVGSKVVKSPLPGSVLKISVKVGQSVKRGDLLLTLESMKMENSILSESDAVVKTILVQPGQSIMQDDVLIDFE